MDKEALSFLAEAKKRGFASGNNLDRYEAIGRPGSKNYLIADGHYKYVDSHFGSSAFVGGEILYYREFPIWGMNYCGKVLHDKYSERFLKEALSHVSAKMPLRGPETYSSGPYTYEFSLIGNIDFFAAVEKIKHFSQLVYLCHIHGGEIVRKARSEL
jgi:hypothetical protein